VAFWPTAVGPKLLSEYSGTGCAEEAAAAGLGAAVASMDSAAADDKPSSPKNEGNRASFANEQPPKPKAKTIAAIPRYAERLTDLY